MLASVWSWHVTFPHTPWAQGRKTPHAMANEVNGRLWLSSPLENFLRLIDSILQWGQSCRNTRHSKWFDSDHLLTRRYWQAFIDLPTWRHVQAKISAQHLRSRCNDKKEGLPLMHEADEKMKHRKCSLSCISGVHLQGVWHKGCGCSQ